MKPTTRAIAYGIAKSPINTGRELAGRVLRSVTDVFTRREDHNYMICLAHPDDEILTAGLARRMTKYGDPVFLVGSDGSGNTDQDRLTELANSYGQIGYRREIISLLNERSILQRASANNLIVASPEDLDSIALDVSKAIDTVARTMVEHGTTRAITDAYEGGHLIHDLTNMIVVYAAKRSGVEVYETPQYSLSPHQGVTKEQLYATMNQNPELFADIARYVVGIPIRDGVGLTDPRLNIKNGVFHVTLGDILTKERMRRVHKSQDESLRGGALRLTHVNLSTEHYLKVPEDRDFMELPEGVFPIYELCHWREIFLTFETFREIAMRIKE